ncbi:MAG: hypothetical protein K2N07_03475 [Desulfovibrio sp.]|nr:hypothetical protein [Desulfovibrio sp.]
MRPEFRRSAAWEVTAELFPPLDAAAQAALNRLPEALARVRPLMGAHRRSLPEDIAALSRALTAERAELRRPYWSRPAFVSAYLHYFLPWNLVRLTRLLRGLPLPAPEGGNGPGLLLDAGSGPLTVPLALWLARPEWRAAPVQVLALDSASQPLELGRALFAAWGEVTGEPVWPVRLERGPLESLASRALPLLRQGGRPWLVTAANVLNEVRPARRGHGSARDDEDDPDTAGPLDDLEAGPEDALVERLDRLLAAWAPLLAPAEQDASGGESVANRSPAPPALLFVEPGTRLGGTTLMRLRELALEGGLHAVAPCTADTPCPLSRGAWCHFTFSPQGAPRWLAELTATAGLTKRSLSLSPLLLTAAPEEEGESPSREAPAREARVLSSPFAVPGVDGLARYGCAPCGLALLEDAGAVASGSLVRLGREERRRDARSGARIFEPGGKRAPVGLKKKS